MDEQGFGGSGAAMGATAADKADNSGPLEDRLVSKNWSTRAAAFEELLGLAKAAKPKSKDDLFRNHADQWKVYLKDSNPGALEKCLTALMAWLDKTHSSVLVPSQNEMIGMLVEKCLGHMKQPIKEKSMECLLLIFEVGEDFDESMETLNALIQHKNIKVLTSGVVAVAALVDAYGIKKVKIQNYAENMLKNAQNTNPACKKAAYDYYKGVYKWLGDALLPQIEEKLKKAQMEDLKKLFAEVGEKTKRLTRTEAAKDAEKKAVAAEEASDAAFVELAAKEEAKVEEEVIDALEFAPEVDILATYTGEWEDATAAIKQWQDKKAKFDELAAACANKKVKPGNFEALATYLKKEVSATNVNTAMAAILAGAALAVGARKGFQAGAKILMGATLLKFKEKRPMVHDAVNKFLDASIECVNLQDISEEVVPCITHVAPGVKNGTIKFVEKIAFVTYIDVLQNVQDSLLPAMVKAIDDKDGTVRDSALHCMGILKGRLTESVTAKYLKDVNKQKTEKIDEAAKEIQPSKYDRPENWKPPAPKAKKASAPKKAVREESKGDAGDDELMDFDVGPPKRKPPPNIGKKPVKKAAADAEMADEEKKPAKPPPKKPALSSDKPKAAASGKGPSAPVVQDEDLGAGLSKEEAIDKVTDFFDAANVSQFDSAKWQDQVEGFNGLKTEISEKEPPAQILEAVAKFVKAKMKDFKVSNVNLLKGIVDIFNHMATSCETMSKRTIQCGMAFFVDKIGDVKLSKQIQEMLLNASEQVTPKFVSLQVIKHASTAKAPKNVQESCNLITSMIDEFGMGGFPLKEVIDFAKFATTNTNPAVRTAAMKLFCEIYKHVGDVIRNFMADIKESTLKMIDADLDKVEQYGRGEHEKKRSFRGEAAQEEEAAGGGKGGKGGGGGAVDLLASLPRQDVSKKLTSKLMEQFKNKDWKIRKKGGEDVEAILKEASMRIEANGINDLMSALKGGMTDPNKAVVKAFIQLTGLVAEALGPGAKQFQKRNLGPMLDNISDKQALVRADVVASVNKWADAVGPENVLNYMFLKVALENPESRTECLKWILEHIESIPLAETGAMVAPLIACLSDKSKAIRDQVERVMGVVMPIVGYTTFTAATKSLKTAVQQTIKPILERVKNSSGAEGAGIKIEKEPVEKIPPKGAKKAAPVVDDDDEPPPNSFAKAAANKAAPKKKEDTRATKVAAPPSRKGEEEDEFVIQPLQKQKRANADSRSKYPLNEVKGDHVDKLKDFCFNAFGEKFHNLMFAKAMDFEKHVKCVVQLTQQIEIQPDETQEVLDIIFKWANLRLTESSNTKLVLSFLELFKTLFDHFKETDYKLEEFEAVVLIPTLITTSGSGNKAIQAQARSLIKACYEVYEQKPTYRMLMTHGVTNQNQKVIAESLDEIAAYIAEGNIDHITKKDFQAFVGTLDKPDKGVREASLKVFGEAYMHLQEGVWRLITNVPIKVKGLLEGRFKTVAKNIPAGGGKANLNISQSSGRGAGGVKGLNTAKVPSAKAANLQNSLQRSFGNKDSLQFNKPSASGQKSKLELSQNSNRSINSARSRGDSKNASMNSTGNQAQPKEENKLDQSETGSMAVTKQLNNLDMAEDDVQPQMTFGQEALQRQQNQAMEMNFNPQPQVQDVEMAAEEDDIAVIEKPGKQVVEEVKNQHFDENDDIMRERLRNAEFSVADPALRRQEEFIQNHLKQLRIGDLLKRVDSLVALNEVISVSCGQGPNEEQQPQQTTEEAKNQQKAVINCCNELVDAFTFVMKDIFRYPVHEIPLRFTKYFITIVNKTCASKEIMREVSETRVLELVEQLLTRLLIENLDKIGENKEGELILKNLNSSMLRMLENCQHTHIFCTLFGLLKKYKDDRSMPKLPGLIIKCLLKLSKIMERIIEKLDLERFLISVHEYLAVVDHQSKSQNDELGIRICKTLINEVVKLRTEKVQEAHAAVIASHPIKDQHIGKWIKIIISSLKLEDDHEGPAHKTGAGDFNRDQAEPQQSQMVVEFEFKKILADLRDPSKYDQGIVKLEKFMRKYPKYETVPSLKKESNFFAQKVVSSLNKYVNGNSGLSTNVSANDSYGAQVQPQDAQNKDKMSQFRNKISNVKSSNNFGSARQSLGGGQQDQLKSSLKMADFKNKMNKLKAGPGEQQEDPNAIGHNPPMSSNQQALATANAKAGRFSQMNPGNQSSGNLNTSFSQLNSKLSQKWAAIHSGSKKGNVTGRPQLNQTMNTGMGGGLQSAGASNPLNTSSNKFVSRVQGSFASRVQQNNNLAAKAAGMNASQDPAAGGLRAPGFADQNAAQGNQPTPAAPQTSAQPGQARLGAGGLTSSFRDRLTGLRQNQAQNDSNAVSGSAQAGATPGGDGQGAASNQDLQKRLADMKAKLQGLKKK